MGLRNGIKEWDYFLGFGGLKGSFFCMTFRVSVNVLYNLLLVYSGDL